MKIAVLGGGNGSFAAAGDFALCGHDVSLGRRDAAEVTKHRNTGSRILIKDAAGQHDVQLSLVTADIAEAVRDAELILCPAPAFAQHDIARQIAPHLRDGQVVFLPPATFGSTIFARAARDAGNRAAVSFAETGTLPWLARKHGPFEVAITIRAKRLPVGVFPLHSADHALNVIGRAFPGVIEPCGDVLSAALMNAGPIIHPPLIVMNAGPIEHFERWDIHKEGTQASIRRVTDALDAERITVREGFGYRAPHFPLAHHYATEGEQWMYGRGSHDRLTDSGDWRERIVLRDIATCERISGSVFRFWFRLPNWPASRRRWRKLFSPLARRSAARISCNKAVPSALSASATSTATSCKLCCARDSI